MRIVSIVRCRTGSQETGVFFCYSCQKALIAFDLCKVVLRDQHQAKRVMIEAGLFRDLGHVGNSNGQAAVSGSRKPSDNEIIDLVARHKGTTGDGFQAYGAVVKNGNVVFPTYRLADGKAKLVSSFYIDPKNPNDKGKNAKGKPAGVFLPVIPAVTASDKPRVRRPQEGETWIICEGGKNCAAYHGLGFNAVGLNGKHVKKDFLPGFVAAFKGVDVVLVPDGDLQSVEALKGLGTALRDTAKLVRIASLPYGDIRNTGGDDVRDVLKRSGSDGPVLVRQALVAAVRIGKDGEPEEPLPAPCSLRELVFTYPEQRAPVIEGLLRFGETMNIVAAPKQGKSWLGNSLALSVASGCSWLDTFPCTRGRVLLLDAELHPEVLAHRLPAVADAMGLGSEYLDFIDVLPLRGLGIDLLKLKPFIESIEPARYALVILDAWYRFLPLGFSENDNAQVMVLYNTIDSYTSTLKAAWVNIHHASKGDQSGKSTTDVGSGAGSQSRAADTHLIIRQHEQEDVAVIEAVVRSWPPVDRLAIRWSFPAWQLDNEADPRKLRKPQTARERQNRENRDVHLKEDRQAIVNAMVDLPGPETQTFIRDSIRLGNPRFGFAWASLIKDGSIIAAGQVKKGNNRPYDAFIFSRQEPDQ